MCSNCAPRWEEENAATAAKIKAGKHELRDIEEYNVDKVDLQFTYLQRRISAGGNMKTAIKRFLNDWDRSKDKPFKGRVADLKMAMEEWCNA